jgi:hypothetical protein
MLANPIIGILKLIVDRQDRSSIGGRNLGRSRAGMRNFAMLLHIARREVKNAGPGGARCKSIMPTSLGLFRSMCQFAASGGSDSARCSLGQAKSARPGRAKP